jgi:hypothetical protein
MKKLNRWRACLDDDARASNDLSRLALSVNLAQTSPGAQNLGVLNLDEVDLVLGAKSLDELDVLLLGARLVQDA